MSGGVGCRRGSDPALLWLWRRQVATAPIHPLAWEPPNAAGAAQEIATTTTKKAKDKKQKNKQKKPSVKEEEEEEKREVLLLCSGLRTRFVSMEVLVRSRARG